MCKDNIHRQKTQRFSSHTSPKLPKRQHPTSAISRYQNTTPKVWKQKNRTEIHSLKHPKRRQRCQDSKPNSTTSAAQPPDRSWQQRSQTTEHSFIHTHPKILQILSNTSQPQSKTIKRTLFTHLVSQIPQNYFKRYLVI